LMTRRKRSKRQWLPKWSCASHELRDGLTVEIAEKLRPAHWYQFPALTGNKLWDAGLHLGRWLAQGSAGFLAGRRCVELGAGLGLPGVAAACCGAKVLLTDLAANVPALCENCRRNAGSVAAAGGTTAVTTLDWDAVEASPQVALAVAEETEVELGGPVELIIGADVSWCKAFCEPLTAVVLTLAGGIEGNQQRSVEAIFSHTSRHGWGRKGESPEGLETFPLGPRLEQEGFELVQSVDIGDKDGTYIFHYARGTR